MANSGRDAQEEDASDTSPGSRKGYESWSGPIVETWFSATAVGCGSAQSQLRAVAADARSRGAHLDDLMAAKKKKIEEMGTA